MKSPINLAAAIIKALKEENEIDVDYMAYKTGSTITQVEEEGRKLRDLRLIQMDEKKMKLVSQSQAFNKWDSLKK